MIIHVQLNFSNYSLNQNSVWTQNQERAKENQKPKLKNQHDQTKSPNLPKNPDARIHKKLKQSEKTEQKGTKNRVKKQSTP